MDLPFISNKICDKKKPLSYLTAPCSVISYHDQPKKNVDWYISVHPSLMINLTIHRIYVTFSKNCAKYKIQTHEGYTKHKSSNLGNFCGIVQNENIYSKGSRAVVSYKLSRFNKQTRVSTLIHYQTHLYGTAYSRQHLNCLPVDWNIHEVTEKLRKYISTRKYTYHILSL